MARKMECMVDVFSEQTLKQVLESYLSSDQSGTGVGLHSGW